MLLPASGGVELQTLKLRKNKVKSLTKLNITITICLEAYL